MPNQVISRREMVRVGQQMENKGLIVAAEGNISVRLGGHSFLVTPAGRNKGALKVQDLVEVDFSGRSAQGKATSEWPLHREIYLRRPDVGAVCHAHPPWGTAFSVAGRDLDGQLLTETAALMPRVPVAKRARPGTEEVPASIRPLILEHDVILLGHHGAVSVGKTLEEAFFKLQTVERLAQVTLPAEIAGGNYELPEDLLLSLLPPSI